MDAIDALGELIKATTPPPGYTAVANSKKGGYRKRVGSGYQYWYPGDPSPGGSVGEGTPARSAPQQGGEGGAEPIDEETAALQDEFQAAIDKGQFKGTFEGHVDIARGELAQHDADKDALVNELTALAAPGAKVKARTKKLDSVLGKMLRKPKYKDASQLQDLTGGRVILKTVDEVKKTVDAIKQRYKIVTEDNYIDTPQGDYRSWHLIIEHNGKQKEIQVRTRNQNVFADWAHDIYKPVRPEQEAAMRTEADTIAEYSKQAADYLWAKDSGKNTEPPYMPPCSPTIRNAFGCLEVT